MKTFEDYRNELKELCEKKKSLENEIWGCERDMRLLEKDVLSLRKFQDGDRVIINNKSHKKSYYVKDAKAYGSWDNLYIGYHLMYSTGKDVSCWSFREDDLSRYEDVK